MSTLHVLFENILQTYYECRTTQPFSKDTPVWPLFEQLESEFELWIESQDRYTLNVQWSAGRGNWAKVPWLAILDSRATDSITTGIYVVYLFRADMSGVYLCLTQGTRKLVKQHGSAKARELFDKTCSKLQEEYPALRQNGFRTDQSIDLRSSGRGKRYEEATIAHKGYENGAVPEGDQLFDDLEHLLTVYEDYAATVQNQPPNDRRLPSSTQTESSRQEAFTAKLPNHFAQSLRDTGIHFGSDETHVDFVRTFICSLATKRFVILTGLSGSGKTQIAKQFGHWLGEDKFEIIPVRPDWTGSEALFGYQDALLAPDDEGRRGWAVPRPLEFMLRAARDPDNPYLLILDEMNLAHVERYFADALSGMESDHRVLPNLERGDDGVWRIERDAEYDRICMPDNLFIVGTVNVDETTYMFSPKVLDRANTIEFRVRTEDLADEYRRPTICEEAPRELVRGFLSVARNDNWHVERNSDATEVVDTHLRTLHSLLSEAGFEFGHRVFFEAMRFATLYEAAGNPDPVAALDRQVMQKLLPRLHGSRRRLETTLCALARFCHDLTFDEGSILDGGAKSFDPVETRDDAPALPISFDKLRRMTRNLRANQFVSFTE